MLSVIEKVNDVVNNFIWGVPAMICIIGVGLLLSFRTGFIQIRKFPYAMKVTLGRMLKKREASDGALTPFQAVCTALAATVGTGNVAGVAGAIAIGGPGAVFWMWISALLGMCTKFSEVTLAVHFHERNANGDLVGGPMYYIKNGLKKHWHWLAYLFSAFGVLTVFGTGNATQVNTITTAIDSALYNYDIISKESASTFNLIIGIVLAALIALILLGGIKRIGQVTEKLVPFMAVMYILLALGVVIVNFKAIDRGGVFAQLIGTVELLEDDEKAMVKGLIINKFRGDKTILDPGVVMLEERSGIPVVGVAPYLDIQVEDEDSLTERFDRKQEAGVIDIAVVRTPRISNFTDFNPFESIPGVSLRYVKHPRDLHSPDMIILPGTKNTMGDLIWMRESGMEAAVLKEASRGKLIFGVCGGYQMLGETLSDPHGVENGGSMKGMGLLPMETVFAEKKTRTRVQGHFGQLSGVFAPLSGAEIEGYEIHMGESILKDNAGTATKITDSVSGKKKEEGAFAGNVCGTYIHGVFDKEASAEAIIRVIGEKKGIDVENMTGVDFAAFKEQQYDILAAELRKHLDMKKIYEILENGITEEE